MKFNLGDRVCHVTSRNQEWVVEAVLHYICDIGDYYIYRCSTVYFGTLSMAEFAEHVLQPYTKKGE